MSTPIKGTDLFRLIYDHPLLKGQDYEAIDQAHTRIECSQGTMLLEQGKTANEFYLIGKGLFRSFLYDYHGNEITTGFYCPNDILIESFSLFKRVPSKESFQALSDATAWKIQYNVFQELLQK